MANVDGKGLEQFKMINTPALKELHRHVTPQYAAEWREIGVELGLTDAKLREIEANNPRNVKQCCNRMFSEWLRMDTTASWEKLFTAIESPAVFGGLVKGQVELTFDMGKQIKGAEALCILSNRVAMKNAQARFRVEKDTWPPNQPNTFTPLLLVHHEGQHSMDQAVEVV
ncbi:uncharacterized protein [Dysidea avara]|uniref:uncharacterized protein isoform X2 n=1 Tax=Dysidea avara TaxID=196820 RepID=UPI00331F6ECC